MKKDARRTAKPTGDSRVVVLSACMIVRNGLRLGYPFVEAALAVIPRVDELVVVDGKSDDGTWDVLSQMAEACPRMRLFRKPWPSDSRQGKAIAVATNHALRLCRGTHILNVQADEIHTTPNLQIVRYALERGCESAEFPFLHFRNGWWRVSAHPSYTEAIRCVPNHPETISTGDGCSFRGPLEPILGAHVFPNYLYHIGWVYPRHILEKHVNHAKLYTESSEYQDHARRAREALVDDSDRVDIERLYEDEDVIPFDGAHPKVIRHLVDTTVYDPTKGLKLWAKACKDLAPLPKSGGRAKPSSPGATGGQHRSPKS